MSEQTSEPLARYLERHVQVRREFSLYPDRVVVHARWLLKGQFTSTVTLETLRPQFRTLLIRNRYYRYAGWLIAAGMMVLAISVYQAGGQMRGPWPMAGMAVAAAGLALMGLTYRKIPFARFDTREGRAGLDIGCAGSGREAFDEFVQRVKKQIQKRR